MERVHRLATYGSLAPGRPNAHQLQSLKGRWISGHVHGTLVEAGWGAALGYPALVLAPTDPAIELHVFESIELPFIGRGSTTSRGRNMTAARHGPHRRRRPGGVPLRSPLDVRLTSLPPNSARQLPYLYLRSMAVGTIIWTAPSGQIYTTHPGSRLLFPSLCKPTAPISAPAYTPSVDASRGLMMPRRKHTREYNRQRSIEAERRLNRQPRRRTHQTTGVLGG